MFWNGYGNTSYAAVPFVNDRFPRKSSSAGPSGVGAPRISVTLASTIAVGLIGWSALSAISAEPANCWSLYPTSSGRKGTMSGFVAMLYPRTLKLPWNGASAVSPSYVSSTS